MSDSVTGTQGANAGGYMTLGQAPVSEERMQRIETRLNEGLKKLDFTPEQIADVIRVAREARTDGPFSVLDAALDRMKVWYGANHGKEELAKYVDDLDMDSGAKVAKEVMEGLVEDLSLQLSEEQANDMVGFMLGEAQTHAHEQWHLENGGGGSLVLSGSEIVDFIEDAYKESGNLVVMMPDGNGGNVALDYHQFMAEKAEEFMQGGEEYKVEQRGIPTPDWLGGASAQIGMAMDVEMKWDAEVPPFKTQPPQTMPSHLSLKEKE
jgi:hypothetical protein